MSNAPREAFRPSALAVKLRKLSGRMFESVMQTLIMKLIPCIGIIMLSLVSCHDRDSDHNMPTDNATPSDSNTTSNAPDTSTHGVQDSSTSIGYDSSSRRQQ